MEEKKKRPQDRWDEKAGMISKTYKVNKKVAEEFQAACKEKGIAMGVQLTNMMKEFIENNKYAEFNILIPDTVKYSIVVSLGNNAAILTTPAAIKARSIFVISSLVL